MAKPKRNYGAGIVVLIIFAVIFYFAGTATNVPEITSSAYNYLVDMSYPDTSSVVRCYDYYGIAINTSVSEFNHTFFDVIQPMSKYQTKSENNVRIVYKINYYAFINSFPLLENKDFQVILNNWTSNEIKCRTYLPYKQWKYDIYDNGNKKTKNFILPMDILDIDCKNYGDWQCTYVYHYSRIDTNQLPEIMQQQILNYNFEGF